MRRDNHWEPFDLICGYIGFVGINTPHPPSVLHIHLICPQFPSLFVYPSPPSSPRRRPSRLTAGQPTPWSSAPTSSKIPPAPRCCSASHHRVRVCDALIQSSILCFLPRLDLKCSRVCSLFCVVV